MVDDLHPEYGQELKRMAQQLREAVGPIRGVLAELIELQRHLKKLIDDKDRNRG